MNLQFAFFFSRAKIHFDDGMIQPIYYGSLMSFLSLSLIMWLIRLLSSIKPGLVKKINRLQTPIAGLVSCC